MSISSIISHNCMILSKQVRNKSETKNKTKHKQKKNEHKKKGAHPFLYVKMFCHL